MVHGAGLLGAVKALQSSLQELGSDLIVLLGDMERVLPQCAAEHGASSIILEEEVEYKWVDNQVCYHNNTRMFAAQVQYLRASVGPGRGRAEGRRGVLERI